MGIAYEAQKVYDTGKDLGGVPDRKVFDFLVSRLRELIT